MKHEEQRIPCGGIDARDQSAKTRVRGSVRISLQSSKQPVLISQLERLCFISQAHWRLVNRKKRSTSDAWNTVGSPELQGIRRTETNGADGVRHAEKLTCKDIRRRPIESPVGKCNARI